MLVLGAGLPSLHPPKKSCGAGWLASFSRGSPPNALWVGCVAPNCGFSCRLCSVTQTPLPPFRVHASPWQVYLQGAAASPPVTIRNLPQPVPPPSYPLGGIRRELTAQTPRLQRGQGRGREGQGRREKGEGRRTSLAQAGFLLSLPLCLAHIAQPWGHLIYGRITWVWHVWWGLFVRKKSLRPGWTPSQNQHQDQDQGIRGPAQNPHQLLNACALSANTTASLGPSTSPTCSRTRQAGFCAPSFETTCAPSAVPLVIVPTPAASARSPAKATPLSTAIPPATLLARGWLVQTRRGPRTRATTAEEEQEEEPVQVAGEICCGGGLPPVKWD